MAIAAYLLGESSTGDNVRSIAETELSFYQTTLFGGSETARTGLRMIPAFYYRDYKLLREIYLEGRTGPDLKKISATLKAHEERGSFPTGTLLLSLLIFTQLLCDVFQLLLQFLPLPSEAIVSQPARLYVTDSPLALITIL